MEGSGLAHLFENNYGKNTVNHIMDGKATSRALSCNYLVGSALRMILLELMPPTETNEWKLAGHLAAMEKCSTCLQQLGTLIMPKVGGLTFNLCWIQKKITHGSISLMKREFTVFDEQITFGLGYGQIQ